jgi:SAM-dependent methyltransferase
MQGRSIVAPVLRRIQRVLDAATGMLRDDFRCSACGAIRKPRYRRALWPDLVREWRLTPDLARMFNLREGLRCRSCGANLRASHLASAICRVVNGWMGTSARNLDELFRMPGAQGLSIAEINSAHALHGFLRRCEGLAYSEFGSTGPGIPSENLMALSYADERFDLVVTSDVLEHVPDLHRALRETRRVLKPRGAHVFTVPVIWDRDTVRRAIVEDGSVRHLLPPTHHGTSTVNADDFLVFHEFGRDIVDSCAAAGFDVEVVRDPRNPTLVAFIARKAPSPPPVEEVAVADGRVRYPPRAGGGEPGRGGKECT